MYTAVPGRLGMVRLLLALRVEEGGGGPSKDKKTLFLCVD